MQKVSGFHFGPLWYISQQHLPYGHDEMIHHFEYCNLSPLRWGVLIGMAYHILEKHNRVVLRYIYMFIYIYMYIYI